LDWIGLALEKLTHVQLGAQPHFSLLTDWKEFNNVSGWQSQRRVM